MTNAVLLRRCEVETRFGVSKAWLYREMKAGRFPHPIRIGAQAVRWRVADLKRWEESRTPTELTEDADGE